MTTDDLILDMQDIHKSFAGVPALRGARLRVGRGEAHALIGQNGAGKSTLLKVLTGVYSRDRGSIRFDGADVGFGSPYEAQRAGISPIYQEINLVPQRTVAENVFLGREPRRLGIVDRRRMVSETEELLSGIGVHVNAARPLETFSTATQQMVAIARALSFDSRLIIMDEPTSSLHDREVQKLFEVIRQMTADGVSVVFVSHKLDELYAVCDRITVLRDGRTIAEARLAEMSRIDLVAAMLGRDPQDVRSAGQTAFHREQRALGDTVLTTRALSSWPALRGATIEVRAGEIVGLAGLLGSGRSELAESVFGARKVDHGEVAAGSAAATPTSPAEAIRSGIALTPEDRKTEGIVAGMSVRENITLSLLPRLSRFGFINRRKERAVVAESVRRLGIKTASVDQPVSDLSGGNQQKVLLARSLVLDPDLLILDEPTRGVDVGAKAEIQRLVSDSVNDGRGVLLISSEMEEILEGSERVYVLRDGETVTHHRTDGLTQDTIMRAMASGESPDARPAESGDDLP
ncbi:sugar ABC transporter ATP-binding protein [Micromonospora sp. CPCC 206060]|uniref:sugar ABC transporter ATP-binding protein n=1 Tax=Micromonospora sp. CPCC 206060 TaxID=3122406 RepID=UPI002FF26F70